jgi:putative NAD(P)-binding protein
VTGPWDSWSGFPLSDLGDQFEQIPVDWTRDLREGLAPLVTVFGAGIAGLSAAHELAERGFMVQVVETAQSQVDEYECQVGGLAANQLSRVATDVPTLHRRLLVADPASELPKLMRLRTKHIQPTQQRFPINHRIRIVRGGLPADRWTTVDDHGVSNASKLDAVLEVLRRALERYTLDYEAAVTAIGGTPASFLSPDTRRREILAVQIRGYTDGDGTAEHNRELSQEWAEWVKSALLALNDNSPFKVDDLGLHLETFGLGSTKLLGDQRLAFDRARSNRVEFHIVEQVIPGEHGFRFFPSFYRHLFDTMRRTPVLDDGGNETPETAFDQLVATPDANLALNNGDGPYDIDTRRIHSIKELQDLLDVLLRKLSFTDRDLLCLQVSMLKYLTSARGRRQNDAENISFWDYVGGDAVGYSPAAARFIKETPKALAAMSATETDARTQCTALIQMLLKTPFGGLIDDFTLNGSSSDAWLRGWKNYLRQKGVRFFVGELTDLELDDDNLFLPVAKGPGDWALPRPENPAHRYINRELNDFFVLAVSFERASDLIWSAYESTVIATTLAPSKFVGPFDQLLGFDMKAKRRAADKSGTPIERKRNPATGAPESKDDPLRDISGIQYFFPNYYRLGRGHAYFLQSEWALTSISQLAYWRDRTRPIGDFIGQHSIDIGDWYRQASAGGSTNDTAWHSTRQQIAEETWKQIKMGLDGRLSGVIIDPHYYDLDQSLEFGIIKHFGSVGNVVLEVGTPQLGSTYTIVVTRDLDGKVLESWTVKHTVEAGGPPLAEILVQKLNALDSPETHGPAVRAVRDEDEILVSPFTAPNGKWVIAVRDRSNEPFLVAVGDEVLDLGSGEPSEIIDRFMHHPLAANIAKERLGPSGVSIESERPVAVLNADDMIEIVDGPRLTIQVRNRGVRVARHPRRGSTRITTVTAHRAARIQTGVPQPGRVYKVTVTAEGRDPIAGSYVGRPNETARDLRDGIARAVQQAPGALTTLVLGAPADDELAIALSPADSVGPTFELVVKDMTILALEESRPVLNHSNFLINLPGQWEFRPGYNRQPATLNSIMARPNENAEFEYCHREGAFRRWVAAGTYMATFTRITTMEAANESARHAVNAILQQIRSSADTPPFCNLQGMLAGDPCDIWDPEENEPADLSYFKKLDEALLEEGLPHFVDILKLGELAMHLPTGNERLALWDQLFEMLTEAQSQVLAFAAANSPLSSQVLKTIVDQLKKLIGP